MNRERNRKVENLVSEQLKYMKHPKVVIDAGKPLNRHQRRMLAKVRGKK